MITLPVPGDLIPRLIGDVLEGRHPIPASWLAVARQHSVLPVYGDFMGYWVLSSTGELQFALEENTDRIEPVAGHAAEAPLIHAALAQAARRYPELAPYCPQRPPTARTCTACDGTGRMPGMPENLLCGCGGAGWLPT